MKILGYDNRLFKNMFPSYEVFKEWYLSLPFSDDEDDVPSLKTFSLIAYEYNGSHASYDPVVFKEKFANDLYTYYKEFEATTKSIDDLMSLTDDDISIDNSNITNIADVPETPASTNVEDINFITQQQKNIIKKGTLQIKKEQLSNKRTYTVRTFLKRFKHLFIKIISSAYINVIEEPEED